MKYQRQTITFFLLASILLPLFVSAAPVYNQTFEVNMDSFAATGTNFNCSLNTTAPLIGTQSAWFLNRADATTIYSCKTNITSQTNNFTLSFNWSLSTGTGNWQVQTTPSGEVSGFNVNYNFIRCLSGWWSYYDGAYKNLSISCAQYNNYSFIILHHSFGASSQVSVKINGVTGGTYSPSNNVANITQIVFGASATATGGLVDNICACAGNWNTTCCEAAIAPPAGTPTINYFANTTTEASYYNETQKWIYGSINITDFGTTNTTIKLYNAAGLYSSSTSPSNYSYNFTNLPAGNYTLNATATNGTDTINSTSKTYTIYGININYNTNTTTEASYYNETQKWIYISINSSSVITANTTINLYNTTGLYSQQNGTGAYSYNFTNLPAGNYTANGTATIGTNNKNTSTNKAYTIYGMSINFNANTTTEAVYYNETQKWIYVSINSTSTTSTTPNTSINLYNAAGLYTQANGTGAYSYNFTNLPAGNYTANGTATIGTNNKNTSTNKAYTIYGINANITNPTHNQAITRYINLTLAGSINPSGATITNYNLSLLNLDNSLNQSLAGNISQSTTQNNNTEIISQSLTYEDIYNFSTNGYINESTAQVKTNNSGVTHTTRAKYYYTDNTIDYSNENITQSINYGTATYINPYPYKKVINYTQQAHNAHTSIYAGFTNNSVVTERPLINLTINTYNITAIIDAHTLGIIAGQYYLNIEITDNNSNRANATRLFNLTADATITSYALRYADNSTITNFTTNLTDTITGNTETQTTTNNYTEFYVINGRNYTSIIDAEGYAYDNTTININSSSYAYTAHLYTNNSVSIYIYDSNNLSLITSDNITIKFIGDSIITYTTGNGTAFADGLKDGTWQVKFTGGNYSTKYYTISVANKSHQELNAYLVSSDYSTIFTIQDSLTTAAIENATFVAEIFNISSYVVTDTLATDISGKVQMYYLAGEKYKFTISATGFSTKVFYLNPILFSSYVVNLDRSIGAESTLDYADIEITYYPKIFYNNETQDFSYLISSPDGRLINYTINLTYPSSTNGSSGSNANGESFILNLNITGATHNDRVNITYTYTTTTGGTRSFTYSYEIQNVGESNYTISHLRNKDYGLGLYEKAFIVMIVMVMVVGFGFLLGGFGAALTLGLCVMGLAVYLGLLPIWSIIISVLIGLALIVKQSSGAQ